MTVLTYRKIVGFILALLGIISAHAEIGITDDTILLGQSAAFSGPAAQLGIDMNMGAKAYFQQINDKGGVHGRKIILRTLDDGYDPARTTKNTIEFIEKDRVFALFGYVGTPTSNAALPIFTKHKVPFIAPFTGANNLRSPLNRYVFNIRAGYFDETEAIIKHLLTIGVQRIAVFHQNDAYGQAGLEGVTLALARRKMLPIAIATVERNSIEVTEAAKILLKANPDAIIQISAYKSCAALIQHMLRAGFTGQFYNVSFVGSKALADTLGVEGSGVVISQVVPFPWSEVFTIQREYKTAIAQAGILERNYGSMEGYIGARVLVEGLKRAGKDLTRAKLITALESIHDLDLGGFSISFSPTNHNGSEFIELTIIGADGKFKH